MSHGTPRDHRQFLDSSYNGFTVGDGEWRKAMVTHIRPESLAFCAKPARIEYLLGFLAIKGIDMDRNTRSISSFSMFFASGEAGAWPRCYGWVGDVPIWVREEDGDDRTSDQHIMPPERLPRHLWRVLTDALVNNPNSVHDLTSEILRQRAKRITGSTPRGKEVACMTAGDITAASGEMEALAIARRNPPPKNAMSQELRRRPTRRPSVTSEPVSAQASALLEQFGHSNANNASEQRVLSQHKVATSKQRSPLPENIRKVTELPKKASDAKAALGNETPARSTSQKSPTGTSRHASISHELSHELQESRTPQDAASTAIGTKEVTELYDDLQDFLSPIPQKPVRKGPLMIDLEARSNPPKHQTSEPNAAQAPRPDQDPTTGNTTGDISSDDDEPLMIRRSKRSPRYIASRPIMMPPVAAARASSPERRKSSRRTSFKLESLEDMDSNSDDQRDPDFEAEAETEAETETELESDPDFEAEEEPESEPEPESCSEGPVKRPIARYAKKSISAKRGLVPLRPVLHRRRKPKYRADSGSEPEAESEAEPLPSNESPIQNPVARSSIPAKPGRVSPSRVRYEYPGGFDQFMSDTNDGQQEESDKEVGSNLNYDDGPLSSARDPPFNEIVAGTLDINALHQPRDHNDISQENHQIRSPSEVTDDSGQDEILCRREMDALEAARNTNETAAKREAELRHRIVGSSPAEPSSQPQVPVVQPSDLNAEQGDKSPAVKSEEADIADDERFFNDIRSKCEHASDAARGELRPAEPTPDKTQARHVQPEASIAAWSESRAVQRSAIALGKRAVIDLLSDDEDVPPHVPREDVVDRQVAHVTESVREASLQPNEIQASQNPRALTQHVDEYDDLSDGELEDKANWLEMKADALAIRMARRRRDKERARMNNGTAARPRLDGIPEQEAFEQPKSLQQLEWYSEGVEAQDLPNANGKRGRSDADADALSRKKSHSSMSSSARRSSGRHD